MVAQKYIIALPSQKVPALVSGFFDLKEVKNNQIGLNYRKTLRDGEIEKWEIEGNLTDKDMQTLLRKIKDTPISQKMQTQCYFQRVNVRPSLLSIIKNKTIRNKRRN